MPSFSRERSHEDSQPKLYLTPRIPMPHLSPACFEIHASSPLDASRSTSAASPAPLPLGSATTPATSIFSSPVTPHVSTQPAFWLLLTHMLSRTSSISSPVVRQRPASPTVIQTLSQRPPRERATPNHALQRTAPRVTVAAIHVRSRLVRAGRCPTSVASFFAPPSQLPRRAPQSLSLGSLGDSHTSTTNERL